MQPNSDFSSPAKLGSMFPPINPQKGDKAEEMQMMYKMMQQMQFMMTRYTQ